MLRTLHICNYALIDELDLEFGAGLTIITGETGAGKSIMLGALSLLMGGRADSRVIADSSRRSIVEATFTEADPALAEFFADHGLEWMADEKGRGEIIVRREIAASGRSKVFINDSAVTLQTLSQLAPRLIDIHSQHANARVNDPAARLEIIDAMAGNSKERADYAAAFADYVALRRRIMRMKGDLKKASESRDFLAFQLEGLDKLKPRRGELAEIEKRFEMLSDADDIRERVSAMIRLLGDYDGGALANASEAIGEGRKVDFSLFAGAGDLQQRLEGMTVELKDICAILDSCYSAVESDPAAMQKLSDRMNLYYEALKRYRVKEADELVALRDEIKGKLDSIAIGGEKIPELEKEARELAVALKQKAERLTTSRLEAAARFSEMVENAARPLGLPNIRFEAKVERVKLSAAGEDSVDFLCSFNKNGVPRPLSETASGGEISRMMLSMKGILAGTMNLPTIIFDEVDTGVSGEVADKMGKMMHDMGRGMQVIVITHLPQVAAKGEAHFKVYKRDEEQRTVTRVRRLGDEERVDEIAAMISGSAITPEAKMAAKALLSASPKTDRS